MDQRTPNFFILGAPKAGTTFLHHALGMADGVFMSRVKEPGFFTSSRDYARGLTYYLDAYFSKASGHAVRGESTPWYLYSPEAAERIALMPIDAPPKFVVLVRRPADRALSMYRDQVRTAREERSFPQAVDDEIKGLAVGHLEPDLHRRYVWGSRYVGHVERWMDVFGAEQVHVVVFEDLAAEPVRVWQELATFLDVELGRPRLDEVTERDRNPSGSLRWTRLDVLIRSFEGRQDPLVERVKRRLPPGLHRRVLQRIDRLNQSARGSQPVEVDDATRRRIHDACIDDTSRLEKVIGRALPEWSEDEAKSPEDLEP